MILLERDKEENGESGCDCACAELVSLLRLFFGLESEKPAETEHDLEIMVDAEGNVCGDWR